jgi:hypothetical protein
VCILDVCCVFYSIISTHGYGDSMYVWCIVESEWCFVEFEWCFEEFEWCLCGVRVK